MHPYFKAKLQELSCNRPTTNFLLFLPELCDQRTRSCYGCGGNLKPENKIPPAPQNLVVVARTQRQFVAKGQPSEKEGNVYFHIREPCLKQRFPDFNPALVYIPQGVREKLDEHHVSYLQVWGVPI